MKKASSLMLAAVLATTLGATTVSASGNHHGNPKSEHKVKSNYKFSSKFKDLGNSDWALRFVTEMSTKGVISGYEDGSFRPGVNVTHEEAIIMTIRTMGLTEEAKKISSPTLELQDANSVSAWARPYVALALDKGLIEKNTTLRPRAHADREWVTEMVVKALGLEAEAQAHKNDTLPFKDAKEIDKEAIGYIAVASSKGIINGYAEDKTFKPNKPVQRNELAVILCNAERFFDYDEDRQTETQGQLQGTFKNTANGQLTFSTLTKQDISYKLAANYYVFVGNSIKTLNDLKPGMWVRVLLNANGEVVFVQARETAPDPKEVMQHAKGTVSLFIPPVDNLPGSITLTQANDRKLTVAIAPGAKVLENTTVKAFTDIQVGRAVDLGLLNNTVHEISLLGAPELDAKFIVSYVKNNLKLDMLEEQVRLLFGKEDAAFTADGKTSWRFDVTKAGYTYQPAADKAGEADLKGLLDGSMKVQIFIKWEAVNDSGEAKFYYVQDGKVRLYTLGADGKKTDAAVN